MKVPRKFKTIYLDPPWPEKGGGKIVRGAQRHYDVMKVPEIIIAVGHVIDRHMQFNSHIYCWATNNYLPAAFECLDAWSYRYVTMITWYKQGQIGLGQYYRGCTEHCLFGVRGRIPYRMLQSGKRAQGVTGFVAPRTRQHSEKPHTMRMMIQIVSPGPYLELFGRKRVPGWAVWGDEV